MKLLIASDIHGDGYYAEVIEKAFHIHHCDILLLLGDLLYHGPRNELPKHYDPKKVIALLNKEKEHIVAIRGNCDAEVDQMVLDFPIMSDYTIIGLDGYKLFATHGHIYGPDNLPSLNTNDIFLYGHTHIPVCVAKDNITIINPGSISLPKENNTHSYGVLENRNFTLYDENHQSIKYKHLNMK